MTWTPPAVGALQQNVSGEPLQPACPFVSCTWTVKMKASRAARTNFGKGQKGWSHDQAVESPSSMAERLLPANCAGVQHMYCALRSHWILPLPLFWNGNGGMLLPITFWSHASCNPLRTSHARSGIWFGSPALAACLSEGGVAVNLEEVVLITVQRGCQVARVGWAPSLREGHSDAADLLAPL